MLRAHRNFAPRPLIYEDEPRSGTWQLICKSDGRWNYSAHAARLVQREGIHPDAKAKIEELQRRYYSVPVDLRYESWNH